MLEEISFDDEQAYLDILSEDDPYGPEFVPIDEEEYEYTAVGG